jgi:hypothetical protein
VNRCSRGTPFGTSSAVPARGITPAVSRRQWRSYVERLALADDQPRGPLICASSARPLMRASSAETFPCLVPPHKVAPCSGRRRDPGPRWLLPCGPDRQQAMSWSTNTACRRFPRVVYRRQPTGHGLPSTGLSLVGDAASSSYSPAVPSARATHMRSACRPCPGVVVSCADGLHLPTVSAYTGRCTLGQLDCVAEWRELGLACTSTRWSRPAGANWWRRRAVGG